MKRPTIGLAMIVKDEAHNLPELIKSVEGCFDEIHITDTGSADDTVAVAESLGCTVHHFKWVSDFSAARNFAFDQCPTDYVCWLDGDDSLVNKEAFILWRDNAMAMAEYWLAVYDYASDPNGKALVSFARERVIKKSTGLKWNYFIHEGIPPAPGTKIQYITTWRVKHRRTVADMQKDKFRNLGIFEKQKEKLDHRMKFYYGKELFEAQKPMEAYGQLLEAIADPRLEGHDRILGIQYSCYSLMQCNQFEQAINMAYKGLQLDPTKAEFHVVVGDCYLKLGKLAGALPFFTAAKNCTGQAMPGDVYAGPTFSYADAYNQYPRNQIARIYFQMGQFDKALIEAQDCWEKFHHEETKGLISEIEKVIKITTISSATEDIDEIVFSTPAQGAYPWDEKLYETKGMGGSETACIEMAKWIHKLTGKPVKVFNNRDEKLVAESGVEYIPNTKLNEYFSKYKPRTHIAWRHNIKLTDARTFLWCHDLVTPGVEVVQNFDKILCLSPFHKRYVRSMQGVPEDKVWITRNGLDISRFKDKVAKNENKIIFPSSPDRGLDRAMLVMDKARADFPDLELHVFYGFDNLRKYGLATLADKLEGMIKERPWVKYHGFTEQKEMAKHWADSAVWLHPANFIESSCIVAMECMVSGTYAITRDLGALPDTLKPAVDRGMATILDLDCETAEEVQAYTDELIAVLREKRWQTVSIDPEVFSWQHVAEEWIKFMEL